MSQGRAIRFSTHVAAEFLIGFALAILPFILDYPNGAMWVSVLLGAALMTFALSTRIYGHRIGAHGTWDWAFVFLLAVAAVVSLIDDPASQTIVFAAAAVAEGLLAANTRYTPEQL